MAGGISYPISWTDIANLALGRLGIDRIGTITDTTDPNASYCRQFLGAAVEDVLTEFGWKASTKRVQLAQLTDTPAYGFAYAYQVPVDFIRPEEVETGGEAYSIEGEQVLTDAEEEVYLTYVARPADATEILPYLRILIAIKLASILALPLTHSEKTQSRVDVEYEKALKRALSADAARRDAPTVAKDLGFTWWDELR